MAHAESRHQPWNVYPLSISQDKVLKLVKMACITPNALLSKALKMLVLDGTETDSLMVLLRGVA